MRPTRPRTPAVDEVVPAANAQVPSASAPSGPGAVLLATCLASFLTPFTGSALNLAIPAIGRELHASALTLNWVVGAFLLASAALLLPFGRLADIHGRGRIFLAGTLAHAATAVAAAFVSSAPVLVALRALQGASGALMFATGVALLTSAFPKESRGRVLGINTAAVYTGLSLGPVAGGWLTELWGWRSIFAASAGLGLIAAAAGRRIGRGPRGAPGAGFDVGPALLYAASLAALLGGAAELGRGWGRAWVPVLGAAGLARFVWREAVSRRPLLDVRLFATAAFALSNLAALIHYSATFAVGFLLSLYLQIVRGLDASGAGLVLLVQPVLMALLSPPAGRLSDRVEPRFVASAGMALTALGLALFAGLGADASLGRVVAGLLLLGVGFALFSSPNTNAVMSSVPHESYGVAAATLGTMRTVGQAASLALVGLVLGRVVGDSALGPESVPRLLRAMQLAFGVFAGLCLVGTGASLARGRVR